MNKKISEKKSIFSMVILIVVTIMLASTPVLQHNEKNTFTVFAQAQDDNWSTPVNLSNSGGTTSPIIVTDGNQLIHVFWKDVLGGMLYSHWDGTSWIEPVSVSFPFSDFDPKLVADGNGYVHAIWTNLRGELVYSRARSASVGTTTGWSSDKVLAESAISADLTVDNQGGLHLIYVRTLNNTLGSSGVYYRRSTDSGGRWFNAIQLYSSAQIRTLNAEAANVHIRTTETQDGVLVYAVWDNRPLKRIYLSKSFDTGVTWSETQEVEGPETSLGASFPYDINLILKGDKVLLIWKSGQPGLSCVQFNQLSNNRGETWSERQPLFPDLSGCPIEEFVLQYSSDFTLLFSIVSDQAYLAAWDGENWSQPQVQRTLSGFTNPVTFDTVKLGCRQPAITQNGDLYVSGCDEGQGGDIWVTWYSVGSLDVWFPPPPIWSGPHEVLSDDLLFNNLASNSDQQGNIHLVYNQIDPQNTSILPDVLNYSRFNEENWSEPVAILESPRGRADYPSLAIDGRNRLMSVWHGGEQGEIFYSWANAEQAEIVSEWSKPIALPVLRNAARTPDILVFDQTVLVVYSIPLNENRGIYLVRSLDSGTTWESPILVFDGAAAGWDSVGAPKLARSNNGTLSIIWSHNGSPDWEGIIGLANSLSTDNGSTWSDAASVIETPIGWYDVIGGDGATLHRFWQEVDPTGVNNYHQYSLDGGITWSGKIPISSFGYYRNMIDVVHDQVGGLHLLEINLQDDGQSVDVNNWVFRGDYWAFSESFNLGNLKNIEPYHLKADITPQGKLIVICTVRPLDPQGMPLQYQLLSYENQLEVENIVISTPVATESINVEVPESPTATAEGEIIVNESTPTPQTFIGNDSNPTPINPTWLGLAMGGVIAAVLVMGAVFFAFRRNR